jgi:hypothetical protein
VKEAAAEARRQEEEVGGFLLVQVPCSYFVGYHYIRCTAPPQADTSARATGEVARGGRAEQGAGGRRQC